uniref:CRISPR-associated endonuclease Cas1 n=1 Tax=candidate division WOR-3 bacterium TaxID=2052148 RepID=A0A7C2K3V9_UNCW3
MKQSIYIFSDGEIKRKGNTIYFETKEGKRYIPVENTQEILVFGEVSLNKRLLEFLTENEIVIHFFNYYGFYIGSYYPREHLNSGYMILKQAEHYLDYSKRLKLAKKFVWGAVKNIQKVLEYYAHRGKPLQNTLTRISELQSGIEASASIENLMAIEGNIRDHYYESFDIIIENPNFTFEARTRKPPKNMLNALISFSNSLIYVVCLSEIYRTHLDPRIGFLHSTNMRRFTLNLDLAEIFKPIIGDRVIFSLINKGMMSPSHFEEKLSGIILNEKGKQIFLREFDERLKTTIHHRKLNRHVSYRELIRLEIYKIQKHLMGEEEYNPFIAWW